MKTIAFVFFVLLTLKSFGQVKEANSYYPQKEPWFFLDSVKINKNQMYFNPDKIVRINVVKSDNTNQNSGKVYISSKNPKDFNFITLTDIERTYSKSKSASVLFMIDNKILKDNILTYKIDSDYILAVEVLKATEIESLKSGFSNLKIINIKLKTEENIAKANEIYIRGTDITRIPYN
jgi:hypothetical protein